MYSVNDIITAIIGTAGAMSVISYFIAALYFDTNDEKQRLETELVELKRKNKMARNQSIFVPYHDLLFSVPYPVAPLALTYDAYFQRDSIFLWDGEKFIELGQEVGVA